MVIMAIDPGKNGGIAYRLGSGEIHSLPMPPTPGDVMDMIRTVKVIDSTTGMVCYMEECIKYAGNNQSGSSAIVYGRNYGFIEGVIQTLGIKLHGVRPQQWLKELEVGRKGNLTNTEWKNKLKALSQRLFPTEKITLKTADALLILEYAIRKELK